MSILAREKQNADNAAAAQKLADMTAAAAAEKQLQAGYIQGEGAARRGIEQELARLAAQQEEFYRRGLSVREEESAWKAANQELIGQAVQDGYFQPDKDPQGAMAAVDRMLWDRNAPAREAADRKLYSTKDITPTQPGLADTFRGIGL